MLSLAPRPNADEPRARGFRDVKDLSPPFLKTQGERNFSTGSFPSWRPLLFLEVGSLAPGRIRNGAHVRWNRTRTPPRIGLVWSHDPPEIGFARSGADARTPRSGPFFTRNRTKSHRPDRWLCLVGRRTVKTVSNWLRSVETPSTGDWLRFVVKISPIGFDRSPRGSRARAFRETFELLSCQLSKNTPV
jgi:hypothetical protein